MKNFPPVSPEALTAWAQSFIGKELNPTHPYSKEKSKAISFRLGDRMNGAWFKLESGESHYESYQTTTKIKPSVPPASV